MRKKTEQQNKMAQYVEKDLDQITPPDVIPKEVLEIVHDVRLWVRNLTDDWNTVKREIVFELHPDYRHHFTTRDPITKENITLNEMEQALHAYWEQLTGVKLVVRTLEERRKLGIRLR